MYGSRQKPLVLRCLFHRNRRTRQMETRQSLDNKTPAPECLRPCTTYRVMGNFDRKIYIANRKYCNTCACSLGLDAFIHGDSDAAPSLLRCNAFLLRYWVNGGVRVCEVHLVQAAPLVVDDLMAECAQLISEELPSSLPETRKFSHIPLLTLSVRFPEKQTLTCPKQCTPSCPHPR